MIKKTIVSVLFLALEGTGCLFGQGPGGTQFSNAPLFYNPAYTGMLAGMHVRFLTRNQGPADETTFRSYHLSADIADRNLPGSGGIGLIFNSDNEGIGFIKNYSTGISFSARVPLSGSILGQVGVKMAWLHKTISWNDFVMSEKIRERYGHIYDSGFIQPDVNVLNSPDFAVGGLVQFINDNGSLSGTFGVSVDHLFEPDGSFLPDEQARLPRRWTGHADFTWALKWGKTMNKPRDEVLKLNPGLIYQYQGGLHTLQAGSNITKFGLYGGLWFKGELGTHTSTSLALLGGYRYTFAKNTSLKFTYSYDKPLTGIPTNSGGAHEISLVLEFNGVKLFKGPGYSSRSVSTESIDTKVAHLEF
jgi:type IX secretion system PorP/SprF family membrane protein